MARGRVILNDEWSVYMCMCGCGDIKIAEKSSGDNETSVRRVGMRLLIGNGE